MSCCLVSRRIHSAHRIYACPPSTPIHSLFPLFPCNKLFYSSNTTLTNIMRNGLATPSCLCYVGGDVSTWGRWGVHMVTVGMGKFQPVPEARIDSELVYYHVHQGAVKFRHTKLQMLQSWAKHKERRNSAGQAASVEGMYRWCFWWPPSSDWYV